MGAADQGAPISQCGVDVPILQADINWSRGTMDDSRFENLLRVLTASPSRRSALRTLGALALGGAVATSFTFEEVEARKCGECKKKKRGRCKKIKDGPYCSVG